MEVSTFALSTLNTRFVHVGSMPKCLFPSGPPPTWMADAPDPTGPPFWMFSTEWTRWIDYPERQDSAPGEE